MLTVFAVIAYIQSMGKVNILKSNYVGKVGETYGVEVKNKSYVKAVPFSHTPHNEKQNKACYAFSLLNRLSAVIAKNFWQYLDLSDKNMYRNNAVAKWLKSCLVNNQFVLANIENEIPADGSLQLQQFDFDYQTYLFNIVLKNTQETENINNEKVYISVVTNNAVSKFVQVAQGENIFASSMFDYIDFAYFQVLCFKEIPWYKKHKIKGLVLSAPVYVIIVNHVFYIMRWRWNGTPKVINHVLYLPAGTVFIQGHTMFLR